MTGARDRVGAAQEALLQAVIGGADPPGGFDGEALGRAGRSLHAKRSRSVAAAWPRLHASLGSRFGPEFDAFAAFQPGPPPGGPPADGWLFANRLRRAGRLPPPAEDELIAFDLRFSVRAGRLRPRRIALRVRRRGRGGPVVVALAWPGGQVVRPLRLERGRAAGGRRRAGL